jgi:hypothetical protein
VAARQQLQGRNLMTREAKLDLIWNRTHADFKGIASNPGLWRPEDLGKRTVLVLQNGGTALSLLEYLTDDEIEDKLRIYSR